MTRIHNENENNNEISREVKSPQKLFEIAKFYSKNTVWFFDYDGTLAPFVSNPMEAFPDPKAKAALQFMVNNTNLQVVIVTGRPVSAINQFLPRKEFNNLICISEHGAYLYLNNKESEFLPLTEHDKSALIKAREFVIAEVKRFLSTYKVNGKTLDQYGITLDDIYEKGKAVGIPLHSRAVKAILQNQGVNLDNEEIIRDFEKELMKILEQALQNVNQEVFAVEIPSPMCIELKPKFNKGMAVEKYLAMETNAGVRLAIFCGDAIPGTDQSAADFVVSLKQRTKGGTFGYVFHVKNDKPSYEKAQFCVESPQALGELLSQLTDCLQQKPVQNLINPFEYT